MKAIQPKIKELKEKYGDDKHKFNMEQMELFKREKVNPASGCLPVLAADPGVLLALQGAGRHHRNASRAVLRLDQGPLGAGPDQCLQPVRPAALRSDACRDLRPLSRARRLAAADGRLDVAADEDESGADRRDSEDDVRLDAGDLHLHHGRLRLRPAHLLDLEQSPVDRPAGGHHEARRREVRVLGQSAQDLRSRERRDRDELRLHRTGPAALCRPVRLHLRERQGERSAADRPAGDRLRRPLQRRQILAAQRLDRTARRSPASPTRRDARSSSISSRWAARRAPSGCASSTCPAMAMRRSARRRSRTGRS